MNYYVVPGVVSGLAVFFFIALMFLFIACEAMSIQSPPYFLNPDNKDCDDKAINWGHMEDVE